MAYEDLLVNGTSLKTLGAITDFSGILSNAPLRGESVTYPGVAGATFTPKVRDAYVFSVPMVLYGGLAAVNDALDALRALLDSSTTALTLVRHRTLGSGTVAETASGEYLGGLEPGMVGMSAGRVAIDLMNLSGGWT